MAKILIVLSMLYVSVYCAMSPVSSSRRRQKLYSEFDVAGKMIEMSLILGTGSTNGTNKENGSASVPTEIQNNGR